MMRRRHSPTLQRVPGRRTLRRRRKPLRLKSRLYRPTVPGDSSTLTAGLPDFLAEIEARQDSVLDELDALNGRIEETLKNWAPRPAAPPPEVPTALPAATARPLAAAPF